VLLPANRVIEEIQGIILSRGDRGDAAAGAVVSAVP